MIQMTFPGKDYDRRRSISGMEAPRGGRTIHHPQRPDIHLGCTASGCTNPTLEVLRTPLTRSAYVGQRQAQEAASSGRRQAPSHRRRVNHRGATASLRSPAGSLPEVSEGDRGHDLERELVEQGCHARGSGGESVPGTEGLGGRTGGRLLLQHSSEALQRCLGGTE